MMNDFVGKIISSVSNGEVAVPYIVIGGDLRESYATS